MISVSFNQIDRLALFVMEAHPLRSDPHRWATCGPENEKCVCEGGEVRASRLRLFSSNVVVGCPPGAKRVLDAFYGVET